jgi:hypothetical protein
MKFLHMRLGRGGYVYGFRVIDTDGKHVGDKFVRLEKSGAKESTTYTLGDDKYGSAAEFREAYNRKIEAERRDREWEAAAP